ncbi:MAG: hypothetical protein ACR2N8_04075 [Parvibaculales bacterium]
MIDIFCPQGFFPARPQKKGKNALTKGGGGANLRQYFMAGRGSITCGFIKRCPET